VSILFEDKYVDLRMDLFDYYPATAYNSGNNTTKIFFDEGANIASAQPCVVKLSANDNSYVESTQPFNTMHRLLLVKSIM